MKEIIRNKKKKLLKEGFPSRSDIGPTSWCPSDALTLNSTPLNSTPLKSLSKEKSGNKYRGISILGNFSSLSQKNAGKLKVIQDGNKDLLPGVLPREGSNGYSSGLEGQKTFQKDKKDAIETKFITKFMRKGNKELAEITLLKALKKVEQELLKKDLLGEVSGQLKVTSSVASEVPANLVHSEQGKKFKKENKNSLHRATGLNRSVANKETESRPVKELLNLSKILEKIIDNAKPLIRLKKVRISGTTHQKPTPLTKKQAETDAIKRIIINAKARPEKSAALKLAKEFEEIYLNVMSNKTLTEVRELHKLAEINKANITLK